MAVLAQTYIHLSVHPTEIQIYDTLDYVQYLGAKSAKQHFRQDIELELRIEEGSLKGWLTVLGGLYLGLSNYGSLREGIDYAVKDSREFSAWIIEKFKSEVEIEPSAIYRTERRLGISGKIQRLYPLLDETSILLRRDGVDAEKQLRQVQQQLTAIANELSNSGESKVLEGIEKFIPLTIRNRLPPPEPPQPVPIDFPQISLGPNSRTRRARPTEILLSRTEPPSPPRFR